MLIILPQITLYKVEVGGGYAVITFARGFRASWLDSMIRARDSFPTAYLQMIKADYVINERHVALCLYNVVMAHSHGYNKMRRLDSELLINLSGVNNFEDALKMLAPKEGDDIVVVSFSNDKEHAEAIMEFFMKDSGAIQIAMEQSEKRISNVARLNGLSSDLPAERVLNSLAERSAMFYARYR